MNAELTQEEKKLLEELTAVVANELTSGKSKEAIAANLKKLGWSEEAAKNFIERVDQSLQSFKNAPSGRQALSEQFSRLMLRGFLWAAGGIVVTAGTYSMASSGGTYVIAWGAVAYGLIEFFIGLAGWLRSRPLNP